VTLSRIHHNLLWFAVHSICPPDQKAAIQNALNETFSAVVRINFEDSQDAICGIELPANGQKVAWSISSYLGELRKKVSDLADPQSPPTIKDTPKPDTAAYIILDLATAAENLQGADHVNAWEDWGAGHNVETDSSGNQTGATFIGWVVSSPIRPASIQTPRPTSSSPSAAIRSSPRARQSKKRHGAGAQSIGYPVK
jgi:hypothetical protein